MSINENRMRIIPMDDTKNYSGSEENDTINLENNSNDLSSYQNFLIGGPNTESYKYTDKNCHALVKKEKKNPTSHQTANNCHYKSSNGSIKHMHLMKRKKGFIGKDPYCSTHLILGSGRTNKKLKKKILWNRGVDQNTNASELSYIRDFENNSFMHDNSQHLVLYDNNNRYMDYSRNVKESRSEKMRYFFVYSPDIIQRWLRVIFNIIITSLIVTLIYFIFISIREDINKKVAIQVQNVKEESNTCKKQYYAHKCGTVSLPLLNEKCEEWLKCMNTDHKLYQDISFLSAQILGQIMNAFIVQFEWKSICVIAFIFLLIFIGSNYALSIGGANKTNNTDYNLYNPIMNPSHGIPPYPPYFNFYPYMPSPLNYNNSYSPDFTLMNPSYLHNKYFQDNFNRNPYNYSSPYQQHNNGNNDSNNSVSRNKENSENYNQNQKDGNKDSKKVGFLKYLTRDFK
ncbi:nucleus export protein BRR6, putative [Plasmodium berghei]|uniref:Nucleus export protein BRR6, putative n=2 Tax=Plasmodium berghei TaxID=5821 RepID=A0A509AUT5_PLABA|nr:nucleus export protein BRR6, putative [Plasmodium berghei ANKA]CXJ22085.1 nucleus export protein BRR6, putative [Plasmodium berghei]SCM26639.1 nucleus export protein BRR6, putative [Plasmodium berghei]SCN28560.1 nucleus export protein BRR6, putative [Plasmodium berghei]SCO62749.1 nucleus export protein BRR6, putative [Plasmodium berghei]SCO64309.1 nucleus export protein BRR6, putative [Plasmodium berghei]|eukprot:XP_034424205.1 nucleus export protein BRR6, putative [Plasmodium berghei ANKA]